MTAVLDTRDLRVTAGRFVLGPVSLSVTRGEYVALLGPSGCGKTTFLRAVAGILPTDSGRVFLDGTDASRMPVHRRGIGYVTQEAGLFPHMTVRGNIGFGLAYRDLDRAAKAETIRRVASLTGVDALLDRGTGGLSGGERRRAALARSLAVEPRLLLLDEPLGMLDHNAREGMLATLRRIHDETGTPVLHVTHDRNEAVAAAGRCLVMQDGRIAQDGPVDAVFAKPRTAAVADFLCGCNCFDIEVVDRDGGAVLRLPWGERPLPDDAPPRATRAFIRPEDVELAPGGDADAGGVVRLAERRLTHGHVVVETAEGCVLHAYTDCREAEALRPGDPAGLRFAVPLHLMEGDG